MPSIRLGSDRVPVEIGRDGFPVGAPEDYGLTTLGYGVLAWGANNIVTPDGGRAGELWQWTPPQKRFVRWWYAVDRHGSFLFNHAQIVAARGSGKSPFAAALSCCEFGGPVVFDYFDRNGQPVGKPHPKPHIQLAAVSEEQTDNTMSLIGPMIGHLEGSDEMPGLKVATSRITSGNGGKLHTVTTSAVSRHGARLSFVVMDEALALDTVLPTPSGPTTMEKVQAGDWLYGSDGQPVQVVKTTEIQNDRVCYRVTFADGTSVVTSDGHLWAARRAGWPMKYVGEFTTGQMAAIGGRWRVPLAEGLAGVEANLPVDPYCLGAWLGDGSREQMYVTAHADDADEIAGHFRAAGFRGEVIPHANQVCTIALSGRAGFQNADRPAVVKVLGALPCYRRKHVPEEYFTASRAQRTALVQGLMDTDGHVGADGYCTFVGNEQLSSDLMLLLRGLGQVPHRRWIADVRSRVGGYYKVHFIPRRGFLPVRLARKASRVRQTAHLNITITSIEPVESVPVKCVAVDSDNHLFAIGDGHILTHNTHLWDHRNGGVGLATVMKSILIKTGGRSIETTNTWINNQVSVAKATYDAAQEVLANPDSMAAEWYSTLRYHPTGDVPDLTDTDRLRSELKKLYRHSPWVPIEDIVRAFYDVTNHPSEMRRMYLNEIVSADAALITEDQYNQVEFDGRLLPGDVVTLGFDGSKNRDATVLVACRLSDRSFHLLGVWQRQPSDGPEWEVPRHDVDEAVAKAFAEYKVAGFYADVYDWQTWIDKWSKEYREQLQIVAGVDSAVGWDMRTPRHQTQTAHGTARLVQAIEEKQLLISRNHTMRQHVLNARRWTSRYGGEGSYTFGKAAPESPNKVDAFAGMLLADTARHDLLAKGWSPTEPRSNVAVFY